LKPLDRKWQTAATTLAYAGLTVIMTWPLAGGLSHDIPGDFGDPLLNCWILAWDATHFGRGWWNANIFYPHPLALAYSEHLAAQAGQILPIYLTTGNAILCYNLLFLSTFVLSGLGSFLLVRELTDDFQASLVAGVAYAFAPYRFASVPHLQVLSASWMPFVLYGFRRYFATVSTSRVPLALAGAAAAWIVQNLSCGYYLVFFAPVVALYLVWEITTRGLWSNVRAIVSVTSACAVVGVATAPFLLPYVELRHLGFTPRSITETQRFSADVYGYLTADPSLRVWGSILRLSPKAEGALFPGVTVVVLAIIGVIRGWGVGIRGIAPRRHMVTLAGIVASAVVLTLLLGWTIRLPGLKITSLPRALMVAGATAVAALAASRNARERVMAWIQSPAGVFSFVTLFAIVMSFGPEIRAMDRVVLDHNVYEWFYRVVPGFDGLRVPARYGMIVALGLAVLAGLGLSAARGRMPRARWPSAAAALFIAVESFAAPIPINQNSADYKRPGLAALPALQREVPAVYGYIASLPPADVIVELPLGEPAFDVRYMYSSTRHWRRLVNGYTGGQPAEYEFLDLTLQEIQRPTAPPVRFQPPGSSTAEPVSRKELAWGVLRSTRATHAVVHEAYYAGDLGRKVSEWLRAHGAKEIAAYDSDHVFQMP
jgi:hypothetical protein